MGVFMTKPDSEKHSQSGIGTHSDITFLYGASSMQGWRVDMEDAHSSLPLLDQETSLFAVYDGHGGKEVALYCRERLPELLKASPAFSEGEVGAALKQVFMDLDVEVSSPDGIQLMKELLKQDEAAELGAADSSSDDEDYRPTEAEALLLKQEAQIPVEDIVAQFGAPPTSGRLTKSRLQSLFEEGLVDSEDSEGSGEELSGCESPSESSEEMGATPSPSSPTSSQPSDPKGMQGNENPSSHGDGPLPIDTSSNLDVPNPQQLSLPSPIHTPDKLLPSGQLLDSPSQQELDLEDALEEQSDEVDRTPVLQEPASSGEEEEPAPGANKPYELSRKTQREGFDSGSTAVVCVIKRGNIVVANAGDSRCVLCRRGEAYPLSYDHKPTDKEELRRITRAGGVVGIDGRVNAGLNLSRAIGDHTYKKNKGLALEEQMISAMPDLLSTRLEEGDRFLVLACDGIWNVMENQEVVTFIQNRLDQVDLDKEGPSALARISEELCDGCLADNTTESDGSGCDNMTVIIIVLQFNAPKLNTPNQIKTSIPDSTSDDIHHSKSDDVAPHQRVSENGSRQNGINRKRKGSRIMDDSKRVKPSVDL